MENGISQQVESYRQNISKQDGLKSLIQNGFKFDRNQTEVSQYQIDSQNLWMLAQHVQQQKSQLQARLSHRAPVIVPDEEIEQARSNQRETDKKE